MESIPLPDRAGRRRFASDHVQLSPRRSAAQQRASVPTGSADRGGDHRRDARCRRWSRRRQAARRDRSCSGAPGCGSARRSRSTRPTSTPTAARCSSATARAISAARSGWTTGRGHTSNPGFELRRTVPVGRLFCVVRGPTRGRPCAPAGIRAQLHHAAVAAGVRRRFAPHQLRHAHAVEMSREGISLIVIQRQLGHADLAITSRYLRGIDNTEIIQAVHQRPEPMIPAGRHLLSDR